MIVVVGVPDLDRGGSFADAIPLAVLKREQDRIAAALDQVTRRLDAHHGQYIDARNHLDDALALLENCADVYA